MPQGDGKAVTPSVRALWRSARVESCSDGTLRVIPEWRGVKPYTDEDGGGPGLLSRLAAAERLRELIERELKRKAK